VTGGYRERALSAVKWSVTGDMAEQGIRLTFGVALARLLSPRDFGLIAMLTAVTQIVGAFADLGLGDALVQRRELTEAHRSSVFWVLLLTGGVLSGAQIAGATAIATLYGVKELAQLAVVVSALFVLDAIGSVPRAILARRLAFRIMAWLQCAVAILASACAVMLAWRGFGVKSLAADLLLTSALESLLLFRASGWRPRLELRVAVLRDLLGFSTNRVIARMLALSASPVDRFLIGKFLGSGALGLYVRAYNLARLPVLSVSRAIVRAMFPSLALIQQDAARIREVYLRTTAAVALVTFPMCLGLFAAAEPLIVGVLGSQWRETVPILRILSLAGLVQSITVLASTVYLSQGRADVQLRLAWLERLSTIAAVAVGLRWGVLGTATAYLLATVLNALPTLYFASQLIHLRQRSVFAHLAPVFLASTVMTAIVLGVDAWVALRVDMHDRLALEVAIGVLAYWVALRLSRVRAYRDVIGLLQRAA
jgi:O-antigen/teichoic acid export membrane protein